MVYDRTKTMERICEEMAKGRSLKDICDNDEGVPHRDTIHTWLAEDTSLSDKYARAAELRADHIADEIFDIADDANNDWMERLGPDGKSIGWVENGEALGRSRLRIDARKWALSKMNPKKYGDKLELAGDQKNPLQVTITSRDADL